MNNIFHIKSISEVHKFLGLGKPKHPLVMVIPNNCIDLDAAPTSYITDLYTITLKNGMSGSMQYGRSSYDFEEGTMLFIAPGQVIAPVDAVESKDISGWTLLFHPDLIRRTSLGQKINQYSFFSYQVNEALHLSETEKQTVTELIQKVIRETEQNIDQHTGRLISGSIELLLDYCTRFYDRQFYTRSDLSSDTISEFEQLLRQYFQNEQQLEHGLPTVAHCGKQLGLSPKYLSDLLKKETGKTAKEHIQLFIVELAKNRLLSSSQTVSKIAYDLGFEYPPHFSKLFKKLTAYSPTQFRDLH
ncbi:helix-turn-helix domain-containing protein [Vibrio sp. SCSIO 43137]|uniref:helix-turn-helix domain-containing protein n=1 Tax=Vibrio sp. SCSIO 43137 TaxID=3021011 RepID=UPI0023070188|nr:helix-turn-helix domain-containing protein [Vibrio sp. SCSIO 43137]WCE31786.1 helix-turn-helix domain-containing protein [Vibrio sp. SCSIO 43137]